MSVPEPDERAPLRLSGCLAAIHRTQSLLLVDWDQTCRGDTGFLSAFRRWSELLAAVRLHVLRAETRLRHVVDSGRGLASFQPLPGDRERLAARWIVRFTEWFSCVRIDPTYRHLDSILEGDTDPVTADIVTDLAILAEVMEAAMPALGHLNDPVDETVLADLAFTHVIAPWRARGLAALHQVERWLDEMQGEHDDW